MARKLIDAYMQVSLVKLMVGFVIAMAIILSISVNANATTNHNHKTVKRTEYAVTIDVSVKDGLTYVKTSDGNVWTFAESDSDVGDIYKVTFDTRNTKKKTDDRIVAVKYIGYVFNVKNVYMLLDNHFSEIEVPTQRNFYFLSDCLYKFCI